jgi:hypothetical protein
MASVSRKIQTENSTARSEVCLSSFTASCEGRNFDDEKGWKVARCDGVEMRNLLFQFLLISVIMRRDFLWLHGDRRGGIFCRPLFDAVNAAVINYYSTAHLRTLECLLVESSNKERLDCKVTWHMTTNTQKGRKFFTQKLGQAEPFYPRFEKTQLINPNASNARGATHDQ